MAILIPLLVILLIAIVAIWLIKQIPFPAGLEIIQTVLICIVVVMAVVRVLALW